MQQSNIFDAKSHRFGFNIKFWNVSLLEVFIFVSLKYFNEEETKHFEAFDSRDFCSQCSWYLLRFMSLFDVKGTLFDIKGTLLDVKGISRGIICQRVK